MCERLGRSGQHLALCIQKGCTQGGCTRGGGGGGGGGELLHCKTGAVITIFRVKIHRAFLLV